jgi:predicted nucleic acid-binding protein
VAERDAASRRYRRPDGDDLDEAMELVRRYRDQPLTLFDAILAVLARRSDIPIWTYDHHFDLIRIAVWR